MTYPIALLEEQELELQFDGFDPTATAWHLGSILTEIALEDDLGVLLDIRRSDLVLFRSALPGITPDQEVWAERKANVVLRMESSSALVGARHAAAGVDAAAIGWLDHSAYAAAGGSFPLRVRGVGVVAAVTASGLSSEQDHDLVVRGIRRFLASAQSR